MTRKTINEKNIRENLKRDFYKNFAEKSIPPKKYKMYKGLGLNWRDAVLFILAMFFVGMYQVQAQTYFNLDDVDTGMMLSYNKQGNNYSNLELINSDYNVNISGIIAEVQIKQTFINNSTEWIDEGMYAFPVAENAAVYGMKLIIGKRVIEGEIHEKKQAQQIYDNAKSQGLAASIVKQYRPNLFTTDVANIMPNEKVSVEISYQQSLRYDSGHFDFRLPLAIKSRFMQDYLFDENSNFQNETLPLSTITDTKFRNININLEAGFELTELKSLYHDVEISQSNYLHSIHLADELLYDSNDFVIRWHPKQGNEPIAAMFSEKTVDSEYVLMMLLPPKQSVKTSQKRELVFIIDTSGSMQGTAMNAAKDALLFGLTQLNENDLFNIVEFNSFATELFVTSVSASPQNLNKAVEFIDKLHADGGTNMAPALQLALEDEVNPEYLKQIVFVTDGSVGNEAQLFQQINQDIGVARLFTVAIGPAPNNYFMNKSSQIGRGTYTNIANLNDVDSSMSELFTKISTPALTDIGIEWNSEVVQNPQVLPDLYTGEPIIVTAKMTSFNPHIVISGISDTKAWSSSFRLNKDGRSAGIAKLWARNQIADLTDDYMLRTGDYPEVIKEKIIEVALKHHLVSDFTSLVAVDKTPDISRLVALQAKALNSEKVIETAAFPQTALGWKSSMLFGLLLIMIALMIQNRKSHEI